MGSPWCVERQVRDLLPGDHAWLAYTSPAQRSHIIGAFVRDGLRARSRVVHLTDRPAGELPGVPTTYVPEGWLSLVPLATACRTNGRFDPGRLVATIGAEVARAEREGCHTVRVTLDLTEVLGEPGGLNLLLQAERLCDASLSTSGTAITVCQIDRSRCTPEQLAALQAPHRVLVLPDPEHEDTVLRIVRTFDPPGLTLSGELDASRHLAFSGALTRLATSENGGELHLNLADLGFIDLGAMNILADVAMQRCDQGPLVLDNLSPQLRIIMEGVGWHMLPGIWIPEASY